VRKRGETGRQKQIREEVKGKYKKSKIKRAMKDKIQGETRRQKTEREKEKETKKKR
jgi:hypothetical protein